MKILQVNAVNKYGSTGRICNEISNYLNLNGNDGYIAYSSGEKHVNGYKIGSKIDVKFHGLFSRIFGTQGYFSNYTTKKFLKYLDVLKPDVIHLHNLHGNFINLPLLLKYLAKNDIPTVITLHDCWFYTGKCTHYTIDKCFKWIDGCSSCPRLMNDNPSWFFDKTDLMYNDKKILFNDIPRLAVIGVSDWITNEAKKSFLQNALLIKRIYNWIDVSIFKPYNTTQIKSNFGLNDKFIILGVASGWNNNKGLYKYIELSKNISYDEVIILVGKMLVNIKLPDNIIHVDETQDINELVKLYSMADVYVHLSKEESFGKTIAESLSCGTPAIVYNSTALPELIGEGCGYVIEEEGNNLVEAINKVKSFGKDFYTENCINYVKENFEYSKIVEQTITIYKNIIIR